jgi:CHASE2 domain-containing sensor protein
MQYRLKRIILFSLLGLSYGFFSYYFFGGWWNSSVGSLLIVLFSYLIWHKDFLKHTGLQLGLKTIANQLSLQH